MSVNVTIDDTSPWINWVGGWRTDPTADPKGGMYYRKTFRATPNEGDSATLSFRGTGIWIYGSKRYNHGMYEINLDGDKSTLNGMGEDEFGSVLFGREGLDSNADHTISITNRPSANKGNTTDLPWVDVDYIVVQAQLGDNPSAQIATTRVDDASPRITYSNPKISTDFGQKGYGYYGGTGHLSDAAGDTFSFDFVGQSVTVVGGVNFNHGQYSVVLDGKPEELRSGAYWALQPSAVLYMAAGLENTTHNIIIRNLGTGATNMLDLDYIEYNFTMADSAAVQSTTTAIASASATTPGISSTGSTSTFSDAASSSSASSTQSDLIMASVYSQPALETDTTTAPIAVETSAAATASIDASNGQTGSVQNKLNVGMVAGGAVAGAVALALIGFIIFLLVKKKKRQEEEEKPDRWQEKPIIDPSSDDGYRHQPYGSPYSEGESAPWDSPEAYSRPMMHASPANGYMNTGSPFSSSRGPNPPPSHHPEQYPQSVEPSSELAWSPADDRYGYSAGGNSHTADGSAIYGGIHGSATSATAPSIGEVQLGQATYVPADQVYRPYPGDQQYKPVFPAHQTLVPPSSYGGYQPPEAIFGSEISYGRSPRETGASPQSRVITGSRDKSSRFNTALPPTSVAPSSAVTPDDLTSRMRIKGRAVDAGPIPVSPSNTRTGLLPPDYHQATELLPEQRLSPRTRRGNVI